MLPTFVKAQPQYWSHLPILNRYLGVTVMGTIYLQQNIYKDLLTTKPKPENKGFLLHELEHRKRISKHGGLLFGIKYLLSGKFRFYEELKARKVQWRYLKQYKVQVDLERNARIMSSYLYLWPVSYEFAKKEIDHVWHDLQ